ncbi:MAG TPA: hypothetical protein VJA21_05200 [Verrucomicrobiae bacterium]
MKRSKSIRLVLIGGLSAGALTGCSPNGNQTTAISPNCVYTNNYFVAGVGYYHAPFRAWYSLPYNHFNPQNERYFYGGQWGTAPHESITNISAPTAEVAQQAQARRTDVPRGGFGSTSRSHYVHA